MLQKERRRATAGYANEQLPLRLPGAQSFWGPPNSVGTPPTEHASASSHQATRKLVCLSTDCVSYWSRVVIEG